MSTNQPIAGPEELLAHAGFLGGLVRTLVFDQEQAEDYLQDTWAYALGKPPKSGPGLKTWLATAARNYIRQDRRSRDRRNRREAVAARPEALTPTDEALAREEARRRVVDAAKKLKEPYRTAVVLRYLEDLPPREIARREQVPVETVRTRLKRALALLRNELDEKAGGDRRAWCVALLPLAFEKKKAAAVIGGAGLLGGLALMSTKMKVAFAAILLALFLSVGFVLLTDPGGAREAPVAPDPDPGPEEVAAVPNEPAPPAAPEEAIADPVPADEPAPVEHRYRVGLAFKDEDGRLLEVEEVLRRYGAHRMPLEVRVIPEARFSGGDIADLIRTRVEPVDDWSEAVAIVSEGDSLGLESPPAPGKYRLLVGRPNAAPMLTAPFEVRDEGSADLAITLPSEPDFKRYRLVAAEDGAPLAGATVTPWFEFGDDEVFIPGPALVADGDGEVEIAVLEAAVRGRSRQPTWWISTDTHLGKIPGMSLHQEDGGNVATIEVLRSSAVEGQAYLVNGDPAAGRVVFWTDKGRTARAVVGEDGSFRIAPLSPGYGRIELMLIESLDPLQIKASRVELVSGETAETQIGTPAGGGRNVVVSGQVTVAGRPLKGVFVIVRTVGAKDGENFVMTGEDGTYRKEDVLPGRVRVQLYFGDPRAIDDFSCTANEALDLAAGNERTLDFDLPGGVFLVTVVDDETGEPVPGAVAWGKPMDREAGRERFPGFRYRPGWGLRVGEDGTAELLAMLPGEPHRLEAGADGYEKFKLENEIPGMRERPAEVVIRLKKKD